MTTPSGYGDLPATKDELGFTPAAQALAAIITGANPDDTPLTIGIYGPWGSGKTSLMQMILERLDDAHCTTVWFDAWRYAQQEALWRALLLEVVEALRLLVERDETWLHDYIDYQNRLHPDQPPTSLNDEGCAATRSKLTERLDDLAASLYRSVEREEAGSLEFQWDAAGKLVANTVIRAGFSYIPILGQIGKAVEKAGEAAGAENYPDQLLNLFQRERLRIYREHVKSLEQFHIGLAKVINELVTSQGRRLVIFIDDLDRCLPEQAIGVLEAMKVFLDIRGCIFVLGVDREIIERGIRVRYKEFALAGAGVAKSAMSERTHAEKRAHEPFPVAEHDYLEKIVQVPFTLPPLAPDAIRRFLQKRLPAVGGLTDEERHEVAHLMTTGLLRNPRKVKRSFNIFRLHMSLDRAQGRTTLAGLLAKLTVIQTSFPDLYERIAKAPALLKSIEAIARGIGINTPIPQDLRDEMGQQDARLREMLHHAPWYELLSDTALEELVYQIRVTGEG
ncbi:KAP family P-loop NTPase fold protein [Candidatus Viridilinea mediisalina]|nr:P-loop NTPase fold protein [Candidatus Viridilinea mediisalina]